MANEKKEFAKVTTADDRVFYTRELDRSKLLTLPGVRAVQDVWMTEEEFDAIPATPEAKDFFAGKPNVRGRAE